MTLARQQLLYGVYRNHPPAGAFHRFHAVEPLISLVAPDKLLLLVGKDRFNGFTHQIAVDKLLLRMVNNAALSIGNEQIAPGSQLNASRKLLDHPKVEIHQQHEISPAARETYHPLIVVAQQVLHAGPTVHRLTGGYHRVAKPRLPERVHHRV